MVECKTYQKKWVYMESIYDAIERGCTYDRV